MLRAVADVGEIAMLADIKKVLGPHFAAIPVTDGTIEVFRRSMVRSADLEQAGATRRAETMAQRRSMMYATADAFEHAIGSVVGSITSAAVE
ncbi:hypothetical protein KHC27_17075 [Ancylobacter lacus]|uniref:Uncharacterized protein n=2 Tax=Xanthobacteraceae TaxID=335928 RepID=A0ABU0FFZ9_9HYPH|nr:hypothetical protein [Labrys monachus]MBS7540647.1 hypothetical protein [Ancylobacter lacus]MDQ0393535.1 hypothetical protein [Labrys monachus]